MQSIYVCIGKSVKVHATEFKEPLLNCLLTEDDAIFRLGINLYTIYKYQIHNMQYKHVHIVGSYMVCKIRNSAHMYIHPFYMLSCFSIVQKVLRCMA